MDDQVKIVGKRNYNSITGWDEIEGFLNLAVELSRGKIFLPHGVFKFKSHEESEKWMIKNLASRVLPPSTT